MTYSLIEQTRHKDGADPRMKEGIDIVVDEAPQNKDVARRKDRLANTNTAMRLKVDRPAQSRGQLTARCSFRDTAAATHHLLLIL